MEATVPEKLTDDAAKRNPGCPQHFEQSLICRLHQLETKTLEETQHALSGIAEIP